MPADRNLISGNRLSGVMVTNSHTTRNEIVGNVIGTDASGRHALGNLYGVMLATLPAGNTLRGNLISGNRAVGLLFYEGARENLVLGNWIGTGPEGRGEVPNESAGVLLCQGAAGNIIGRPGAGNTIAHNRAGGVPLE